MDILGSLTSSGNGRNAFTFETVCLMLQLRSKGDTPAQIVEVVGHTTASVSSKLRAIRDLGVAKNCKTTEELLAVVYKSFKKEFVSIEDFEATVEAYQDKLAADAEATA